MLPLQGPKCAKEVSKNLTVFTKQGKFYLKYIDKAILLNVIINQLL